MREVRVKNEDEFIAKVTDIANTSYRTLFFIDNNTYNKLKEISQACYGNTFRITKSHDGYSIEEFLEFKKFCENFYILEEVTCNNGVVYLKPEEYSDKCEIVLGTD